MRSVACLLLVIASGCRSSSEPAEALRLIDGPGVRALVRDAEAPLVVLSFWATWCEPCKEEMPELLEVARRHRGEMELHLVSLDFESERAAAEAFLRSQQADLPSWLKAGKDDPFISAVHDRWTGSIPATMVYGPDRALRHFWEGRIAGAQLEGSVVGLLDEVEQ